MTPRLRVDHPDGYDLLEATAFDFDGGSLIAWRDESRTHLVAAYGPAGWLTCRWEEST